MGIVSRLLSRGFSEPDYLTPHELRAIWDSYSNQWPHNNERYQFWKPASVLPAPKQAIKSAMKLCYAEWPEPIDWTIFNVFFTGFVDLACHLPQEQYDAIETFKRRHIKCHGEELETGDDSLEMCRLAPTLAWCSHIEDANADIVRIRDGFRRSATWDPVDADDGELELVHRSLLESTIEFYTLTAEWRLYILSIGRDRFIENP